MWYLIVSIPDLCTHTYFYTISASFIKLPYNTTIWTRSPDRYFILIGRGKIKWCTWCWSKPWGLLWASYISQKSFSKSVLICIFLMVIYFLLDAFRWTPFLRRPQKHLYPLKQKYSIYFVTSIEVFKGWPLGSCLINQLKHKHSCKIVYIKATRSAWIW